MHLPAEVHRMQEAIARLSETVERAHQKTAEQIAALAAAQRETAAPIQSLTARMERVEAQIEALTVRMERVEAQIKVLTRRMDEFADELRLLRQRVDHYVGITLELRFQMRTRAILGCCLHKIRAGTVGDEVVAQLSESEADEVFAADLLIRGVPRAMPDVGDVWIVVEVSAVIDRYDVERAIRRANVLCRAHSLVIPAVAGERATEGAAQLVSAGGVLLIREGVVSGWNWAAVPRLENYRAPHPPEGRQPEGDYRSCAPWVGDVGSCSRRDWNLAGHRERRLTHASRSAPFLSSRRRRAGPRPGALGSASLRLREAVTDRCREVG